MTVLVSPEGEKVRVIWIGRFCKERGLDERNLRRVIDGIRQHHRGWRCPEWHFTRKPYGLG